MWGTDGTKILTVDDGYVWLFSAVEHGSAECVGWHVESSTALARRPWSRSRWDSIISMAASRLARRLSLRMDHGRVTVASGLRVTGTLGVLGEAATRGLIDLTAAIDRLRKTNFRYSPSLLKATLDRFSSKQQ